MESARVTCILMCCLALAAECFDGPNPREMDSDVAAVYSRQVFSPELSKTFIDEAESLGWNNILDSIDGAASKADSQDLYLYDRGLVDPKSAPLWAMVEPHMKAVDDFVRDLKRAERGVPADQEVKVSRDWIFMRKYSPEVGSTRNKLKVHHDTNNFTINIPLNSDEDYEGGGLFVINTPREYRVKNVDAVSSLVSGNLHRDDGNTLSIPDHCMTHEFPATQIDRVNSTLVTFPMARAGLALVHNHTVFHGVAPLKSGAKYNMLLFYDMPSPEVVQQDTDTFMNLDADGADVAVHFVNDHSPQGAAVELFWIPDLPDRQGDSRKRSIGDFGAGVVMQQNTVTGHRFQAVEGHKLLGTFRITGAHHGKRLLLSEFLQSHLHSEL